MLERFQLDMHSQQVICEASQTSFLSVGAYIFIALELPMENYRYEVKKTKASDVDDSIRFLADHFDYYYHRNISTDAWKTRVC
jgi:hypothetical protein